MKMLWNPPTEIQASGFRSAAAGPQAGTPAAPLPPVRRSADVSHCDGRLRRKLEAVQFLRLTEDESECGVDKTS